MHFLGSSYFAHQKTSNPEKYRKQRFLDTLVVVIASAILVILWARVVPRSSTFLGLIGAGLAVALREPLLSIAGRLAIFSGHMFTVKDRVQINQLSGDIIDIGFFYTRMLEIGNWISGDQATGRIVQFPNAQIFGTPIFNCTQNFSYIWDEVILPITYNSNLERRPRSSPTLAANTPASFYRELRNSSSRCAAISSSPRSSSSRWSTSR